MAIFFLDGGENQNFHKSVQFWEGRKQYCCQNADAY